MVLEVSASSTLAEVDGLLNPRDEGRGGFNPKVGGRGGAPLPPGGGGGGGRGPFLPAEGILGGGGGPGTGGRGPPGLNGGCDGAEGGGGGGGGGGGAALPGPIGGSREFALPGGGFRGGKLVVPNLPSFCEELSANEFLHPATLPSGISIFELVHRCESM